MWETTTFQTLLENRSHLQAERSLSQLALSLALTHEDGDVITQRTVAGLVQFFIWYQLDFLIELARTREIISKRWDEGCSVHNTIKQA